MNKSAICLSLSNALQEELKERADKAHLSTSALADLVMRYGLAKLSDDALAKWARARPNERGALGGGLRKAERAVLAAMEALEGKPGIGWRLGTDEIASEVGMLWRDTHFALCSLKARGLVGTMVRNEDRDRWDRPTGIFWWLLKAGRQ